jgi:site-specific DNA-methyltransferase (adenine-specific)
VVSDKKHGTNLGARPNQVGRSYKVKTGFPISLLAFNSVTANDGLHPTQKPVALYEYLIKTYTNEGETVLDLCMGSGTTGLACKNTGRKFIGIEQDPEYFRIATERIEQEKLCINTSM